MRGLAAGDKVIYHKPKISAAPGPRAEEVRPRARGEDYEYAVDKFWRVVGPVPPDGVEVVTRRGKHHILDANDPRLRRANMLERWLYRDRFPDLLPHEDKADA